MLNRCLVKILDVYLQFLSELFGQFIERRYSNHVTSGSCTQVTESTDGETVFLGQHGFLGEVEDNSLTITFDVLFLHTALNLDGFESRERIIIRKSTAHLSKLIKFLIRSTTRT